MSKVVIYLSVVAWAFTIGSVLALLQDRGFRQALVEQRFRRQVRHLHDPFYFVCGYGETGALVCRTLYRRGLRFTVVDVNASCVDEVDLAEYASDAPALPPTHGGRRTCWRRDSATLPAAACSR